MSETPTTTRRLRRSTTDRRIAGVAGGLGDYLGVDPVLIRVGFVLAVLAGGSGLLAYLVAWLVIPEDDGTGVGGGPASRDVTTVAGIILLALAVAVLSDGWWWTGNLVLPLLLIGAGAWLLVRDDERDGGTTSTAMEPHPDWEPATADSDAAPGHPSPAPAWGTSASTGSAVVAPPPPAPPTGPPVARITVALVALLGGAFGLAVANGADVSAEVILLSCLTVIAAGLVVGAFTGGARSLVVLAVPFILALAFVSAVDIPLGGGVGDRRVEPASVSEVADTYELTAGTLTIDLRDLTATQLATLPDGEPLEIDAHVGLGELDVLTPPGVAVQTEVTVSVGQVDLFGEADDGTGLSLTADRPAALDAPVLHLVLEVGVGQVRVR